MKNEVRRMKDLAMVLTWQSVQRDRIMRKKRHSHRW